jgi:hypothetical protein
MPVLVIHGAGVYDLHADVVNGFASDHQALKYKPDLATAHPARNVSAISNLTGLAVKHHRAAIGISRGGVRRLGPAKGHHDSGLYEPLSPTTPKAHRV